MEKVEYRLRKRLKGKVMSIVGHKTVMVEVTRRVAHPLYKKYINRIKKYMAHDESALLKVGDIVEIEECRPLSACKRWRVLRKVEGKA